MAIKWKQVLPELKKQLTEENWTIIKVAEHYGVSKQRIKQVIDRYFPELERQDYGASKARQDKKKERLQEISHKFNRSSYKDLNDLDRAQGKSFTRKRQNAKQTGWEWDIVMSDLDWPTHCPILGLELDYFAECRMENSPSFDRIDNTKGYVQGNVQVISWRANRIKNDGTAAEHRRIAEYLDSM